KSNGHLSKTEKKDLQRLMDNAGQFFDADALRTLQAFVKTDKPVPDPVIRPLYGMNFTIPIPADIKDKKLVDALKNELTDRHISLGEVNTLIDNAKSNNGLSVTERKDLQKILDADGMFFDADAKTALTAFMAHPSSENPHISTTRRDAI